MCVFKRIISVLLLAVVAVALSACSKPDKSKETLALADGSHISLADLSGKWVVVNYWASWCPHCGSDMRALDALNDQHLNNVDVFAYDYMDLHNKRLLSAMRKFHVQLPEFENLPSSLLGLPADVDAVPVTFILNPNGQLVKTAYGPQTKSSLDHLLMAAEKA